MVKRFAKLGLNNKVIAVQIVEDANAPTEEEGIEYLQNTNNNYPFWKQCFRDGTRKNPAGVGSTYDEDRDAFIKPKPYPSWTLNEDTCKWEAPTPYPADPGIGEDGEELNYGWDEASQQWKRPDQF